MLPSFCTFRSDTSLNLMRSVAMKIDEAAAIAAAAEFSLLHQFKMKSKSHLYRNTYNTVIMGNAFVRMSYFEHHAAVAKCYCIATDWLWTLNTEPRQQPQMIHMLEVTIENVHILYENWPMLVDVRTYVCKSFFRLHFQLFICTHFHNACT